MKSAEKINGRLTISKSLPSPPQILLKLLDACGNSKTKPRELAEIVFMDPSISAKILQLINSSFMGLREKVNDLERAVVYLGGDTIKNIAISASVVQVFQKVESDAQFNMHHFWWHSVMCGTLAKRIAKKSGYSSTDEAFLSGMLHDIGKLVLWVNFKKKYARALQEAGDDTDLLISKEMEIGASHHELGAWMVRQWRLKSLMGDAIYYHHDELERIANSLPLVKIVYLANLFSRPENGNEEKIRTAAQTLFNFNADQVDDILADARDEVTDVARSLGIPATPPRSPVSDSPPDEDALESSRLADAVKHLSLMYGTLQSLLRAQTPEAIQKTALQGFGILFNMQRLLFFLHDTERDALVLSEASEIFFEGAVQNLVIPASGGQSLLTRCFSEREYMDTFHLPEGSSLSIADEQILRLLGSDGLTCLPMTADNESVGIIVAGVSEEQLHEITNRQRLLDLFVSHTSMCLYIHGVKQAQARRLQAERLEASITMARKVVHEVNNPLGIIKNYLRILGLKLPEKHPAQAELGVISEEIDRVGQIIRSLRDYASPAKTAPELLDINLLLKSILNIVDNSLLKPAMIKLHFSPDPSVPTIKTEKNSIKQVIINLVKNAAEAMSKGGNIHITTRYYGVPDKDAASPPSGKVEITIKDDGPGIPGEIREHLFEPFHSTKKEGHSGLGLSIIHNIVNNLGGSISCKTSSQTGTEFKIILPTISEERIDNPGGMDGHFF